MCRRHITPRQRWRMAGQIRFWFSLGAGLAVLAGALIAGLFH